MPDKVKVSCLNCGVTNYYPPDVKGKNIVCGRCKNVLPIPGTVLEVLPERAFNLLSNSSLPVLIDFYSLTCAPCHMMHPIVERLAKRRAGEIMVIKINVDEHPEAASHFGIQGVPTFLLIHKGYEKGRTSGAMSEADFSLWVASRA